MLPYQLLASTLESAPDAIIIADDEGRILFANSRVHSLFGYEARELIGGPVETLLPERLRARHLVHRRNYGANAQVRPMGINLELRALRKDSTEVPVEISLSPVHDGERQLTVAAIRDVTERKRIQRELQHAREVADRANQAKSRFLATASHDLRQPLQTLALLNGLLRRQVQDAVAAEAVAQQEQAIETMSRLLNALLDISKLESGAVRPDPKDFSLASLFEEMRSEFANVARSKGLRLVIDAGDCVAYSDPTLVGQILRNLTSNALKYTRQGEVRLTAAGAGAAVRIEVRDTGIGIPAEQIPFIYDEFFQVGVASNTSREGYGLGLSIVRRLVTLLGVRFEVRSQPGQGTVCVLELAPGNRANVAPPARAARPGAGSDSPRVLLVDDDAGVRNATAMLLRVDGYRVVTAATLNEAVSTVRADPQLDLVVTDYHLGASETGLQVIAAVRELLGRPCKAVLITGDTSSTMREMQPDAGIRLASKPIHADEFLGLVKELLAA